MVTTCSKHIHSAGILSLEVDQSNNDKNTVFCCSTDETFGLWTCSSNGALDVDLRTTANKCLGVLSIYGENVYIAETSQNVITGIDQQVVVKYGLSAFLPSHSLLTFSLEVTALACNGTYLIAGSNDFTVKCMRLDAVESDNKTSHINRYDCNSIVTSISISPDGYYFSLSTADGYVQIRPILKGAQSAKKPIAKFKVCDQFTHITVQNPRIQCCWHPNSNFLYIPSKGGVIIIDCATWEQRTFLTHSDITDETFSVVTLSPIQCDRFFIAASTVEGSIVLWNGADSKFDLVDIKKKIQNGLGKITSIIFNPQDDNILLIAYSEGYICSLTDVKQTGVRFITTQRSDTDISLGDHVAAEEIQQLANTTVDLLVDDMETDLGLIKSQFGFDDRDRIHEQHTSTNFLDYRQQSIEPCTTVKGMSVPKTFAVASTSAPVEEGRYLAWNLYGIIKSYKNNEESTIEINFHDATIHHEIIIDNTTSNYVLGDINNELVALASKRNISKESELYVYHVTSWDHDSRKWVQTMNSSEHVDSLCLGQNFVAVYTSLRYLRIFTAAGSQRYVISLAGHLITMCAAGNQLATATATGAVIVESEDDYEHQININLYTVNPIDGECLPTLVLTEPLPVSPYSCLSWLQFSNSGNLVTMDDDFTLRLYLRQNRIWIPILVGADLLKDPDADALWPISVNELSRTQFRYIYCRNCKHPIVGKNLSPTTTVAFCLPAVSASSERGKLEAELMLLELQQIISRQENVLRPEHTREIAQLTQNYIANLLKLFSVSCQMNRENRAAEIAHRTPNSKLIQGLCNYASKVQRPNLSEKVANIGRERLKTMKNVEGMQQKDQSVLRQRQFASTNSHQITESQQLIDDQLSAIAPSKVLIPKRKAVKTFDSILSTNKNSTVPTTTTRSSIGMKTVAPIPLAKPSTEDKQQKENDHFVVDDDEPESVVGSELDPLDTSIASTSAIDSSSHLFTHSMLMANVLSPVNNPFKKARTTPTPVRSQRSLIQNQPDGAAVDFFDNLMASSSSAVRKQKK